MFYFHLAVNGIRKNARYYVPYILSGVLMVLMHYILNYLNTSSIIGNMKGGVSLGFIFGYGTIILELFAILFLFYTNSFLIRVRNRELGLYSILGMNRQNLIHILAWECALVAGISILAGTFLGVALSKLVELILFHLIQKEVVIAFAVDWGVVVHTVRVFLCIYVLLFFYDAICIFRQKALDLLKNDAYGERKPKGNVVLALLGVILLVAAYYMAATISSPLQALQVFFVAVLMVIVATYLLMITGSVVFCRLLERNRKFYYSPKHFVSVSLLRFRMKRNGAGLASICILMTMVLVMMSMTCSAYFGAEDTLRLSYPKQFQLRISMEKTADYVGLQKEVEEHIPDGKNMGSFVYYTCSSGRFTKEGYAASDDGIWSYTPFYILSLDQYTQMTGKTLDLQEGEGVIFTQGKEMYSTFTVDNHTWKIRDYVPETLITDGANISVDKPMTLVVRDLPELNGFEKIYQYACDFEKESTSLTCYTSIRKQMQEGNGLSAVVKKYSGDGRYTYSIDCRAVAREAFYELYGGMVMLCVLLSCIFLMSTVMIIYYKQISEGFEDVHRFEVLRKVGMSDAEIRKSINAQVLLVFFLPLILAGMHLCAAYPMIEKLVALFAIKNMSLVACITGIVFLCSALVYALIYKRTSNTYYHIVRGEA